MKTVNEIELLQMIKEDKLECKTMVRHKCEPIDGEVHYEYYIYTEGDKKFHRCNANGKLGYKKQQRFMNYDTIYKEFEILEPIEEDTFEDIEEIESNKFCAMNNIAEIFELYEKVQTLIRNQKKIISKLEGNK